MLYLLATVAASTLISLLLRCSHGRVRNRMAMFAVNYAVSLSFSLIMAGGRLPFGEEGAGFALFMGFLNGCMFLLTFVLMHFNIRENGVVLSSLYSKLGVLVPVLVAILAFKERPGAGQVAGIGLAIAAILVMNRGQKEEKPEDRRKRGWLLLLLLLGGFTDSLTNIYGKCGSAAARDLFLLCTFMTAFVLSVYQALRIREPVGKWELLLGLAIGLPNYLSSRFLLKALDRLPAVLVYPAYNVGTVLCITLAGVLLFRETLEKRKRLGLCMILAALVLLSL